MPSLVTISDLNHFRVIQTDTSGERPRLTGRLSLPGQLAPGDYVALFLGVTQDDLRGELVAVDPDAATAVISLTCGSVDALPESDAGLPIYDGYWSDRVWLVLDETLTWTRQRFLAPDAFVEPTPQGGTMWRVATPDDEARTDGRIVPGGWDHEHCELCWAKIGCGGGPEGYTASNGDWVCVRCFECHVRHRDVSFVLGWTETGEPGGSSSEYQRVSAEIRRLIDAYDLEGIDRALKAFGNPDPRVRYGRTPLMVAALRDHRRLVALLLARGADVNAVAEPQGETALALAAQRGYVEMVRILLNAGATVRVPPTLCDGSLLTYVKTGRHGNAPVLHDLLRSAGAT
ncbi:MAG TPA: ankyrin repeat domain-containing protein [Tepidisphaeraceae bacterium]|jgi:hypothetical protein